MKGRKPSPALNDLFAIEKRLRANAPLQDADRDTLIELLEAIEEDQDPREKYWHSEPGAPMKNVEAKYGAFLEMEQYVATTGKRPPDAMYERMAAQWGIPFDAIEQMYKKYLRTRVTTKPGRVQGNN